MHFRLVSLSFVNLVSQLNSLSCEITFYFENTYFCYISAIQRILKTLICILNKKTGIFSDKKYHICLIIK